MMPRIHCLLLSLTAAAIPMLAASSARAALATYAATDLTIAGNATSTVSLVGAGVLAADESYQVNGTLTLTPGSGAAFSSVFGISDGSNFYGGQLRDDTSDTATQVKASANLGSSATDAGTNSGRNTFYNSGTVTFSDPLDVSFVITGGAGTTATVTFENPDPDRSGSVVDGVTPLFLSPLNAENGLSLVLGNLTSTDYDVDSISVAVVPEPATALALVGLASLGLMRRRRG